MSAATDILNDAQPTLADKLKRVQVKEDGTGFELGRRRNRVIGFYSQSNFANILPLAWTPPKNLKEWNGGHGSSTGTAFVGPDPTNIRLPTWIGAMYALTYPDDDVYVCNFSISGKGCRISVGVDYEWDTGTSGDPGTGCIGFDNATTASATEVRFSLKNPGGYQAYVVGTDGLDTGGVRIEKIGDEANTWVEFTPSTTTGHTTYNSQPIGSITSANWPPADGTPVRIWPLSPRMDQIITANSEAIFTALGLTGSDRVYTDIILWPTEAEEAFSQFYEFAQHDKLISLLSTWKKPSTPITYTLPHPYGAAGSTNYLWHRAIRRLAAKDPSMRKVVDLAGTSAANWDETLDYIHVKTGADIAMVGTLIFNAAERGGSGAPVKAGSYTPAVYAGTNVDSVTAFEHQYAMIDGTVINSGSFLIDPTTLSAASDFGFDFPIPSTPLVSTDASGSGSSESVTQGFRILADTSNNRYKCVFTAGATGSHSMSWSGNMRLRARPA